MSRIGLNKYAINLAEKSFEEQGFMIEKSPGPIGQVNFLAVSSSGSTMKIKVRSISQRSSYIFIEKIKFNIEDPDLYMMVLYIPNDKNEIIMYLIPATEWGKDIYPFKGKDYEKPGMVSQAEWGISFSDKARDAMESYRFSKMIQYIR